MFSTHLSAYIILDNEIGGQGYLHFWNLITLCGCRVGAPDGAVW